VPYNRCDAPSDAERFANPIIKCVSGRPGPTRWGCSTFSLQHGQILQGLVRAYAETKDAEIRKRAIAAGDWLATIQHADGSWRGPAAYQGAPHTYYSMVSWALAQWRRVGDPRHAAAADKNIDWVLAHVQPSGWTDGIKPAGTSHLLALYRLP